MSTWEFAGMVAIAVVAIVALVVAWSTARDVSVLEDHSDDRDRRMADMAGYLHVVRVRQSRDLGLRPYADVIEARLVEHGAGHHFPARRAAEPQP